MKYEREFNSELESLGPILSSSSQAEPYLTHPAQWILGVGRDQVETAQPLSKLCLEFPDLYIGCYRESRTGPLVISFEGKDQSRVEAAAEAHCKKFHPGAFYEIN
ncbi:unnamed protein product [Camellia sinensis]